ncbi:MAG: 50S ribosome-binding GTPase, partial [Clostridia bacterium]|nr:50S ribosome-binding GTPase [Clostridia bacterium]
MSEEMIAAIATPPGKGGVAIVRISGEGSLTLAEKMFTPSGKIPVSAFEPYRLYPGQIDGGSFTDYGLCVYFKAPQSYTGEDIIEFQCHGGESIARGILKKAFSLGAKSAGKGEFTKRAFLNGKLSLASAEGVADMINGESEAELRAGYYLYSEKLTGKIREVQSELKEILAGIGASVDYPEEDIEEETTEEIKKKLSRLYSQISVLCAGYSQGKKIKSGVSVAICGKPNTGKSSLLNRLLGYDKAIVSNIAGTTSRSMAKSMSSSQGRKPLCRTAPRKVPRYRKYRISFSSQTRLISLAISSSSSWTLLSSSFSMEITSPYFASSATEVPADTEPWRESARNGPQQSSSGYSVP